MAKTSWGAWLWVWDLVIWSLGYCFGSSGVRFGLGFWGFVSWRVGGLSK